MASLVQVCFLAIALCMAPVAARADTTVPRAVIVAQNSGTEITDLLVPFAILSAAGINVEIVSTSPGSVNLMHGLELLNLRTILDVEVDSLDLVVVPAVHEPDEPELVQWLAKVAALETLVASICDGVEVLASAQILNGRKATGHFYSKSRREANHQQVVWVENTRYVHDGNMVTTAGVSASAPASIYLASLMVGAETAQRVARDYGIDTSESTTHRTADFKIGLNEVFIGARNYVLGLRKKRYSLLVDEGTDEFSFAFVVDALGRTYRASIGVDAPDSIFQTKRGLTIRSKSVLLAPHMSVDMRSVLNAKILTVSLDSTVPRDAIDNVFEHIALVYGRSTARFVALQLELPAQRLVR